MDQAALSEMPHKYNAERRHHIPKMQFMVKNWAEYEAALRRRGSLTGVVQIALFSGNTDERGPPAHGGGNANG